MKARLLTGGALLLSMLGCDTALSTGEAQPDAGIVETAPTGPGLPIDHPPLEEPPASSRMRRVSLFQLKNSIATVLGNDENGKPITWIVSNKEGFTTYGPTLGEADYITLTEDDLEPSALYLKFVTDAARDACNRALDADAKRTESSDRVLLRYADSVDENLRYLKLRFHGIKVQPSDLASIAPLRRLFDAVGDPVRQGWHAVCVALLTDPEFHLY